MSGYYVDNVAKKFPMMYTAVDRDGKMTEEYKTILSRMVGHLIADKKQKVQLRKSSLKGIHRLDEIVPRDFNECSKVMASFTSDAPTPDQIQRVLPREGKTDQDLTRIKELTKKNRLTPDDYRQIFGHLDKLITRDACEKRSRKNKETISKTSEQVLDKALDEIITSLIQNMFG